MADGRNLIMLWTTFMRRIKIKDQSCIMSLCIMLLGTEVGKMVTPVISILCFSKVVPKGGTLATGSTVCAYLTYQQFEGGEEPLHERRFLLTTHAVQIGLGFLRGRWVTVVGVSIGGGDLIVDHVYVGDRTGDRRLCAPTTYTRSRMGRRSQDWTGITVGAPGPAGWRSRRSI